MQIETPVLFADCCSHTTGLIFFIENYNQYIKIKDLFIHTNFLYHLAGMPVMVGLTDVTPPNMSPMGLDNFQVTVCGQFGNPSLVSTFIHMNCPGRSVVGRYLVVQTDTPNGGHVVCEVQVTVEGT